MAKQFLVTYSICEFESDETYTADTCEGAYKLFLEDKVYNGGLEASDVDFYDVVEVK